MAPEDWSLKLTSNLHTNADTCAPAPGYAHAHTWTCTVHMLTKKCMFKRYWNSFVLREIQWKSLWHAHA